MAFPTGFPGIAAATPSSGVEATEVSQTSLDQVDYIYRDITVAPGGTTGWHWHRGRLYGVVKQGTLTHNAADCAVDGIYPAGSSIFEPAGPDNVHIGRNLGSVPLVMAVLYILPAGSALAEDAPNPGCPFN